MRFMGVPGIALGASLSMVISTTLLLGILGWYRHIGFMDVVTLLLNWMLFITLLISIHFGSTPGIILTVFTYIILLAAYGSAIFEGMSSRNGIKSG